MIFQLLIKDDTRLSQAINIERITCFHDLSQQETLSLLQQEQIARSGLHFGDLAFLNFNRMLLYLILKHGPKPSNVHFEQKAVVPLLNQNLVAKNLGLKWA